MHQNAALCGNGLNFYNIITNNPEFELMTLRKVPFENRGVLGKKKKWFYR